MTAKAKYDKLSRLWSPQLYESVSFPFRNYFAFGRKVVRLGNKLDKPVETRIWYFRPREFLKSLFDRWSWDPHCFPSYTSGVIALWNNLMIFLTPWYKTRRHLINDLVNRNECKLLGSSRRHCYMRDRSGHNAYLYVTFGPVRGKVELVRYVTKDGKSHNAFMLGVKALMDKRADEEPVAERKLLFKAPALTDAQCLRFLNRTVEETKDLITWYD